MTGFTRSPAGTSSIELTDDPRFTPRVRRLVAVSSVALGVMTLLVATQAGSDNEPSLLLTAGGWVLMPAILAISLRHPRLRYLLAIPALAVTVALTVVCIQFRDGATAAAGWWLMATGILVGGSLGMWFWFRWLPVPGPLDDPFSIGRWILIAVHVGLIAAGGVLVVL